MNKAIPSSGEFSHAFMLPRPPCTTPWYDGMRKVTTTPTTKKKKHSPGEINLSPERNCLHISSFSQLPDSDILTGKGGRRKWRCDLSRYEVLKLILLGSWFYPRKNVANIMRNTPPKVPENTYIPWVTSDLVPLAGNVSRVWDHWTALNFVTENLS